MKFLVPVLLTLILSNVAMAQETFLPENDMYIPADSKSFGGISEQEFNAVIDKVESLYASAVARRGVPLHVKRRWTDGTVNASATITGEVNMYGGLARHPAITKDGFNLALCHEVGHLVGGAPSFPTKLSAEGEADYFATLKCLRHVFLNDNNAAVLKTMSVPVTLATACAKLHGNGSDKDICIRSGMAAVSVTNLFASILKIPSVKFETPDNLQVPSTNLSYPSVQCRLDTFFQGALCEKSMNEDLSMTDEVKGACHGSTGQTIGVRPRCWFKPSVQ